MLTSLSSYENALLLCIRLNNKSTFYFVHKTFIELALIQKLFFFFYVCQFRFFFFFICKITTALLYIYIYKLSHNSSHTFIYVHMNIPPSFFFGYFNNYLFFFSFVIYLLFSSTSSYLWCICICEHFMILCWNLSD